MSAHRARGYAHRTKLLLIVEALVLSALCSIPAAAQLRVGVVGGIAFGRRDAEHPINPYTGQPDPNYTYYPDSAAHLQGGLAVEALGRFGGLRLSVVYMTAGVVDVTNNGQRVLVCGNSVCSDSTKYNPYPGHLARYVASDLDLVLRAWQTSEDTPFGLHLVGGPGIRRRLNDPKVREIFEEEDRWSAVVNAGGGVDLWVDGHVGFVEFRHSFGLGNREPIWNGMAFHNPNREAVNILRFGLMF